MVEQIVRLPAELYPLVLAQSEVLQNSRIDVPVRLRSKHVSITDPTVAWILRNACSRIWIVDQVRISEELNPAILRVMNRGLENAQISGEHSGNTVVTI